MKSPRDQASAFRVRHGLGDAPIRDMFQVVEDFTGVFVLSRKFPASQEAFTVHDEESGMTIIAVGTSDNYERQRFSVAHELGHLESGRMSADVHSLPDFTSSKDETWAHDFARHLLLPLGAVEKYLTNLGRSPLNVTIESLSDLVRVFGVSPHVAMIQLRDSKWISKRDFEEWPKRLPSLTSRGLAMQFGWASERAGLVLVSLTPRRPSLISPIVALLRWRRGRTYRDRSGPAPPGRAPRRAGRAALHQLRRGALLTSLQIHVSFYVHVFF